MRHTLKSIVKKVLLLILILGGWEIASRYANPIFVPRPEVVAKDFIETVQSGMMWKALYYSFLRITVATVLSAVIAIPIGVITFNCKLVKDFLYPVISAMRFIPVTAFYPLLILWFGIDELMKIVFLFIATFVYMMPSTMLALEEVNENLLDTGYTMGMNRIQGIFKIQLPASIPSLMNSFIMMYGIGWTYIAVTETVNAKFGLGFIIQQSSSRGRTDLVFMAIIAIIIVSVLFDFLASKAVRIIFRWRYLKDDNAE